MFPRPATQHCCLPRCVNRCTSWFSPAWPPPPASPPAACAGSRPEAERDAALPRGAALPHRVLPLLEGGQRRGFSRSPFPALVTRRAGALCCSSQSCFWSLLLAAPRLAPPSPLLPWFSLRHSLAGFLSCAAFRSRLLPLCPPPLPRIVPRAPLQKRCYQQKRNRVEQACGQGCLACLPKGMGRGSEGGVG